MRIGIVQLNASDDPTHNLTNTLAIMARAVENGAQFVLTPEVTNCVSTSRTHQERILRFVEDDDTLRALQDFSKLKKVWTLLGSISIKTRDANGRFANRSFLIDPEGAITAWYDKIHMFDVALSDEEQYYESKGYRPGERAVVTDLNDIRLGMTICYDLRFPALYRTLAQAGADIITVPSAFSPITGAAHWETLLRARAIETGCYILAPAQTGTHKSTMGKFRRTYGHAMAVSPWGEVILDAGEDPGVSIVDLDMSQVVSARRRIPSLALETDYKLAT